MNKKKELKLMRATVRSYISKATDAYIDNRYEDYAFWTQAAMQMNDKIMTKTGFKQRGIEGSKKRGRERTVIYVPVGRA